MKWLTYLIYIVMWETLTIGGSVYLYIWKERSGWWVVLGIILSCSCFKPNAWNVIGK